MVEFGSAALAAFVGTGAAVLALRALSGTLLGHWLAKGLVRYSAQIETEAHSRRIVIGRLDAERSRFIDRFMEAASQCNSLIAHPVDLRALPDGAGPELAYLSLYGQITSAVQSMTRDVAANAHRFEADEILPQLMFQWLGEVHQAADRYYDWLLSVLSQDEIYQQNPGDRGRWLMHQRGLHLILPTESFAAMLERCRHFTQGRA